MLLALAVGLGFGGIRVFLRFFLPNKVFDRKKQIEILQLGSIASLYRQRTSTKNRRGVSKTDLRFHLKLEVLSVSR